jgi:hypothetical protein
LPLFEKVGVEVYLPALPERSYQDLLQALEDEFTYAFGGSTIVHGLRGSYLSRLGIPMRDQVSLLYSDLPLGLAEDRELISRYADNLRAAAFSALHEEAVLVVVLTVHHAE